MNDFYVPYVSGRKLGVNPNPDVASNKLMNKVKSFM